MATEITSLDKATRLKLQKLGVLIFEGYYKRFVADGLLDPEGKSGAELKAEFCHQFEKAHKDKSSFYNVITDHTEDLLAAARAHAKRDKCDIACLFYATWLEHWVNRLIKEKAKALGDESLKTLIRETGLKAKYQCLPALLGIPRLCDTHVNTALRIAELRNGFVHYKFVPTHVDNLQRELQQWRRELEKAETAVRYFQSYECKHIYKGQKKRLRRFLKVSR